jgi:nucleotide-binding universal stress UspA family protein
VVTVVKRIFLPVDGSDHSRRAIAKAAEIARLSGGEIRVFHLQEREPSKAGTAAFETTADAESLVDEAVTELQTAGTKATGETRAGLSGEQAKAIVDEADRFGADLIVLGSRGLSNFEALLLGSVAYKVVHYAHCPVLIVR